MSKDIKKLRIEMKKNPGQFQRYIEPVFLTKAYNKKGIKFLIQKAREGIARICIRVNEIETDIQLEPDQVKIILEKGKAILTIKLTGNKTMEIEVGLDDLLINKCDADFLIQKKREKERDPKLKSFVKSLKEQGYNYHSFVKMIVGDFCHRSKPNDEETYDHHHEIRRFYVTEKEPGKYSMHYSLVNENGGIVLLKHKPGKAPALITLKRYFLEADK